MMLSKHWAQIEDDRFPLPTAVEALAVVPGWASPPNSNHIFFYGSRCESMWSSLILLMNLVPFTGKVSLFSQFFKSVNSSGASNVQLKMQWSSSKCLLWWILIGDLRLAYQMLSVSGLPYGEMGSGREEHPHQCHLQKCAIQEVLGSLACS